MDRMMIAISIVSIFIGLSAIYRSRNIDALIKKAEGLDNKLNNHG